MNSKLNLKHLLGNALMAFSFLFLLFIYYPVIQVYLFPPKIVVPIVEAKKDTSFTIRIPRINVVSPIIENVDPYNSDEYQHALKKGIAHASGTALPGEKGGAYFFAHSSGPPWEQTRNNTIFLRLGELENGDEITIRRNGIEYIYKVVDKKTIWPTEVQYLENAINSNGQLILQTCTPIGTDLQRLLIFGKLVRKK